MKTNIYLLTDLNNRFQTKVPSDPYGAGMDVIEIQKLFYKEGYPITILSYSEIDDFKSFNKSIILYTSIEGDGGEYKDFIEDNLLGLELAGAILVPGFIFFRAHENKVFQEIIRKLLFDKTETGIQSQIYGSEKEFNLKNKNDLECPVVIKGSTGSGSKNVFLVKNNKTLARLIKKVSNSKQYKLLLIDKLFKLKLSINKLNYDKVFLNNIRKFIVQNFINNITNDFKVLIFSDKYYVLKRLNRANDFRASGSHNFIFNNDFEIPDGLLNSCRTWYDRFDVPNAAFDVAIINNKFYLIEFQFINFGTVTQTKSNSFYKFENGSWIEIKKTLSLEEVYVASVVDYLKKHKLV